MKRIFFLLCGYAMGAIAPASAQSGHAISVQIKNFKDTTLYLGNYYGTQTYVVDSTHIDAQGKAVFGGKEKLPGGIYFILLPGKTNYFEILLDKQQHFDIVADTTGHFRDISFKGSEDNTLFYQYNHFLQAQGKRKDSARRAGADSAALRSMDQQIGTAIRQYREKFIQQHPGLLLSAIFRAMEDPQIPAQLQAKEDSAQAYHYFKDHYWGHLSLNDSRLLRTPVLETRLQRYFTQLVPPQADSINKEADLLLARAGADKEVFKFVLWWLTHTYEASPYMGMDAVFVHLVEQYYMTGKAYWLSKDQTQKVVQRAAEIAPNLIGNKAPALPLTTMDSSRTSLDDIKAKYTLLVFWDPTCGHCILEVPRLDSAYHASWKKMGVAMVGVKVGGTAGQWKSFIADHHLQDWIHAWEPDPQTNYRQLYDVYMTPVIYLLDEKKTILAKRLGVQELDGFLKHLQQGS